MEFVFNDRKAAQAAAWLLNQHDGRLRYIKLIKLLYLADREALVQSGYTITGDYLISMDKGPVLSRVLNLITWGSDPGSAWGQYISPPEHYEVSVVGKPEFDELSDFELGLLDQVSQKFGHWDPLDLVDFTHSLPEWEDPSGTSIAIDARTILKEAGRSDEEIRATAEQVEAIRVFHVAYGTEK